MPTQDTEKRNLTRLQTILAACALAGVVGQFFVAQYRQNQTDSAIKDLTEDRKKKIEDYNLWKGQIDTWLSEQRKLNDKIESHLSDNKIHITEDQTRNLIAAQIAPMANSIAKVEANLDALKDANRRIEDGQQRMLDIIQKGQLNGGKDNGR
jgi:hypothetical protein